MADKVLTGGVANLGKMPLVLATILLLFTASVRPDSPSSPSDFVALDSGILMVPVDQGPLELSIDVSGRVECENNSEILSGCRRETTLVDLIPEGSFVQQGDVIGHLDATKLERTLEREYLETVEYNATVDKLEEALKIQKLTNESQISNAKLKLKLARLDYEKYRHGELPRKRMTEEGKVAIAWENLVRQQKKFDYVKRLARKGYRPLTDVEKERVNLLKNEQALTNATGALNLLERHEKTRQMVELAANVDQAEAAVYRAKHKANVMLASRESQLSHWRKRLTRHNEYVASLEEWRDACTLRAPRSGRLIYTRNNNSRRSEGQVVSEGDSIAYRQSIASVPQFDSMIVKVRVHESLVRHMKENLAVSIRVDATPGDLFTGEVIEVASVPTSGSYPNYDLRQYEMTIRFNDQDTVTERLQPGLTAHTTVHVDYRDNCLSVPSQSIMAVGNQQYVFVETPSGYERRPVDLGLVTETKVEILSGLAAEDVLVLSPRSNLSEEAIVMLQQDQQI